MLSKSLSFILEGFHWKCIKWGIVESRVSYIQYRIVSAFRRSNFRLVRNLQRLLIFSFSCRFITVREISENNRSSSIFNKNIFFDSSEKVNFALNLNVGSFSGNLNYFFLSKNKGFSFFFQLPDLYTRCVQSLWNKALIPIVETNSDRNSYGFRPFRDCRDILYDIKNFSNDKSFSYWVLKYRISGLGLSHSNSWLKKHCPVEKVILNNWLSRKLLSKHNSSNSMLDLFHDDLSFTLINFLCNGLESVILRNNSLSNEKILLNFRLIRYLNEFLVFSDNLNNLLKLHIYLEGFLNERCLQKSSNISSIYSIFQCFEFVNWQITKLKDTSVVIFLSRNQVREYKLKLKQIIKNHNNKDLFSLIKFLNSFILSWNLNSILYNCGEDIYCELDVYLQKLLWRWARRRHPRRPNTWIYSKYWTSISGACRFFSISGENGSICFLRSHLQSKSKIVYRIPCSINYFDLKDSEKFVSSWYRKYQECFKGIFLFLWKRQKGICFCCNRIFVNNSINSLRVLDISSVRGVRYNPLSSLVLVHNYCNF